MAEVNPTEIPRLPSGLTEVQWSPIFGGFSGARVWRGDLASGPLALKFHPHGRLSASTLEEQIHVWMIRARKAGLDFVPRVILFGPDRTVAETESGLWEILEWMPGRADYEDAPSFERMKAAVSALADLHRCWSTFSKPGLTAPCPGVVRRLLVLAEWRLLLAQGWSLDVKVNHPVFSASAAELAKLVSCTVSEAESILVPWRHRPVNVQPCLCDIWHNHLLFEGTRVTGLIDYSAAKWDHVAVDLARLLGSMQPSPWSEQAIQQYASRAELHHPELISILEQTGNVVAGVNWLRWLYVERRDYPDHLRSAVLHRLSEIVEHLRE